MGGVVMSRAFAVFSSARSSMKQVVTKVAQKDIANIDLSETAGGPWTLQHVSEPGGAINPDRSLLQASNGQHVGSFAEHAGQVAVQDTVELDWFYLYVRIETRDWTFELEVYAQWRRLQIEATDTDTEELFTVGVTPIITDPVHGEVTLPEQNVTFDGDEVGYFAIEVTSDQVNANHTGLCDDCTFSYVAGECYSGDCVLYDQEVANANNEIVSSVSDAGCLICTIHANPPTFRETLNYFYPNLNIYPHTHVRTYYCE